MSARLASLQTPVGVVRARAHVTCDPVPRGRPPVVLLPGPGGVDRAARGLLRTLGVHFPVMAPELSGLHRSRHRGPGPRAQDAAHLLLRWMDTLELEDVAVVASDVVCQAAMAAAAMAPHRIRRLVLLGPVLGEGRAGTVHPQTLIVSGERDAISSPERCALLRDALPDARHAVLADRAHPPHHGCPEQVTRTVRPFLLGEEPPARVDPPTAPPPAFVADDDPAILTLSAASRGVEGEGMPHQRGRPGKPISAFSTKRWFQRVAEPLRAAGDAMRGGTWRHLNHATMEEADQWMVGRYPQRRYPAVVLGSAGGMDAHLSTVLGAPWFPQTTSVPVHRPEGDVDDLDAALAWGHRLAWPLLERNPDCVLHQVHDPTRDRAPGPHFARFWLKRRRLGPVLQHFCATRLEPGATLFVLQCRSRWPVTRVSARHLFQVGSVGTLTPEELLHGGPRVAAFLRRHGRTHLSFRTPAVDELAPEAEWGFDDALMDDVYRLAGAHGLRVQTIPYDLPQALSATVADLYRNWYARLGRPTWRLVAASSVLTDPTWLLRTSSVPFWCGLPTEAAAEGLEDYLWQTPGVRELHVLLDPHGLDPAWLASPDRWRDLVKRVGPGSLIGAHPASRDVTSPARSLQILQRSVTGRYPWPPTLAVDEVACFLAERAACTEASPAPPRGPDGRRARGTIEP